LKFLPDLLEEYYKDEEIDDDVDETLFIKVLYDYIHKLFLDNGYFPKGKNTYFSNNDRFELKSNKEVVCVEGYKLKIYNLKNKYYLSIRQVFTTISKQTCNFSSIKSAYVFNIISGRSFAYVSGKDDSVIIEIKGKGNKLVQYPENYFFNYNSNEAKNFGFSMEIRKLHKEKKQNNFDEMKTKLSFLEKIVSFDDEYILQNQEKTKMLANYIFGKGKSTEMKDIFRLSGLNIPKEINLMFFFNSNEQFLKNKYTMKEIFASKSSIFFRALKKLGIEKINFIKNPRNGKSIFIYDVNTYEIEECDRKTIEDFEKDITSIGVIILDEYIGDIDPMIKKFPRNIIMQPVLLESLVDIKAYIINSFAYKILNFVPEIELYKIEELEKYSEALFIGLDISHDLYEKKSSFAISAVSHTGKILYLKKYKNMNLNEKMNMDILEKEIIECVNSFVEKFSKDPTEIFVYRDGKYIENIKEMIALSKVNGVSVSLIEVNKNSNIFQEIEEEDVLLKMDKNKYIYFIKSYHNKTAVELDIRYNDTRFSADEISEQAFYLTKLFYGSPYSSLKLPYPVYIADKSAITDFEWRLHIPYLK